MPAATAPGSAPTAVAALRMEALLLWVIGRVGDFPRQHRFTLGDRWVDTCLDAQTWLVEAAYSRDKRAMLASASRALVRARILARLSSAVQAISLTQQAHFDRESTEIGKMVGGWLRAVTRREGPPPSTSVAGAGSP